MNDEFVRNGRTNNQHINQIDCILHLIMVSCIETIFEELCFREIRAVKNRVSIIPISRN